MYGYSKVILFGYIQDNALGYYTWIYLDTNGYPVVKYIRYYFGYIVLDTDRINKDIMGYLRLSQLDIFYWLYLNIIT